ncbi:hypothetical protein HOO68_03725 [Candidatus Gracilibacteria bacterium]|nr:hypothetical protein [Candidatus Gracilibacteria bacterium]
MRHILLVFIFIFCISIDLGSKYYFENSFVNDYCKYEEGKHLSGEQSLGGLSPTLFCSPDYKNGEILESYRNEAQVSLIGDYFVLKLSYNRGIAFSLPIEGIPLKIITILLITGIILYYLLTEYPKNIRLLDIGYSLILAGALSHGYERVFNGFVVDFISIKYFAILNFADIFITIGACFIFFVYYVRKQ